MWNVGWVRNFHGVRLGVGGRRFVLNSVREWSSGMARMPLIRVIPPQIRSVFCKPNLPIRAGVRNGDAVPTTFLTARSTL